MENQIKKQLHLFGEECWGNQHMIGWQILERDERTGSTDEVLESIETHTGKLPATVLIPVQVLYVPTTNFFLMPIISEANDDEETDRT